mmetsp:Transcript_26676/g.66883  ORF Transcript_26676/g.66883 Transcript_26676/m.66883 type:complete len:93 (-) Transcript_26676:38-316(-)
METYGGCHKDVKNLIRPIANAHVQRKAIKFPVTMSRIQARLSFALRRGIVNSLLKRMDPNSKCLALPVSALRLTLRNLRQDTIKSGEMKKKM